MKVVKYVNIIGGIAIITICVIELITLIVDIFTNPGGVAVNFYLIFFALIMIASHINMPCIRRNFFFILTAYGKGTFNIFVGSLLFLNDPGVFSASLLLGITLCITGLVFLILSCLKKVTDEDL